MQQKHVGYGIGLAAAGMMLGLIGVELRSLTSLSEAATPKFIGDIFLHVSTVIAAFVGGKLIPTVDKSDKADYVSIGGR